MAVPVNAELAKSFRVDGQENHTMETNLTSTADDQEQSRMDSALAEVMRTLRAPLPPAPEQSLKALHEAACGDTGGSQAARNFLFWLAGRPDPTGFVGDGGLELRRLDRQLKDAALDVLRWWSGPTKSDQPLYDVLARLRARFGPKADVPCQ